MAERITAQNFEEKINGTELPVLVDFYSDSCIPCKRMSGVLAEIEEEYQGKVLVYKVNANFETELIQKYSILSAPTFLVFKNGHVTTRLSGVQKKDILLENLL